MAPKATANKQMDVHLWGSVLPAWLEKLEVEREACVDVRSKKSEEELQRSQ